MLLNVPITAECSVSSLRLAVREIAFGDCYVRHPYEMDLVLYRYLPCTLHCALFEMDTQGGVKMSAPIAINALLMLYSAIERARKYDIHLENL